MDRPEHFPHAPVDWSPEMVLRKAREEDIELEEDHWVVILALQEYFSHHDDSKQVNRRLLHDALNEKFHHKGDLAYLYRLLPGVPIVQGCRLAGLEGTTRQCGPVLRQHLITACIFNPETWGVLRRSTANRFESIPWAV